MAVKQSKTNVLKDYADVFAAAAVVAVVVMMIIPIPSWLLDFLLALNITGAVVILLLAFFIKDTLEFSILPSLLLIMTLFRLSLNVSSTRLILLNGYAGQVIQQFGTFVISGNAVVGFVVFAILVVIQFIVITKGAERVSEVGARFTLDAMPGKQMSIDADLNSGLITDKEARERRKAIQMEADFYGAMDGSSKFVKGDAIAAIIILLINLTGGFIIGIVIKGMSFQTSLQTYTLLTIGDGLVTQIPALLISTATGLVVTRAASDSNLGQDMAKQLLRVPKALNIAAGVLVAMSLLGLPTIPLFSIAVVLVVTAYFIKKTNADKVNNELLSAQANQAAQDRKPENVLSMISVDPMELEIGYALIPLVEAAQGGDLLDRILLIRRQCASELGFVVPVIRLRDNINLKSTAYSIKIRGAEVAKGELMLDHYLAISADALDLPGIPTKEPAFGIDAKWIPTSYREQAELRGFTVVDPPTVLATHLTEVIKVHAGELLSRQDVQALLDNFKLVAPAVVQELVPDILSLGQVQKILAQLLAERVSIRDLSTILETMADSGRITKDVDKLTEHCRQALGRQILQTYLSEDSTLNVVTLDPVLEQQILNSIQSSEYGSYIALEPKILQTTLNNLALEINKLVSKGMTPIVVCAPMVRINVKRLTEKSIPNLVVLSYNELVTGVKIQSIGMVAA
ncbi:MAG: flagellar biosynthesis protein FlhA [Peptococcaceae bacterium]|nr:flagellar biosynthesis protein FlhA [Peptococcaceae bacterium]